MLLAMLPQEASVRDGPDGADYSVEALQPPIRARAVELTEAANWIGGHEPEATP